MNDFSELEKELRQLRPVAPSADLIVRIERALNQDERSTASAAVLPREPRFRFNWFSIGLGLAAATALVLFAFIRLQSPSTQSPKVAATTPVPQLSAENSTAQFVPAGLTQVVYHTRDEGLRFPENSSEPMRRVRSHSRETLQWRNPKTGASLKISYPSEEVSLVPITGQ